MRGITHTTVNVAIWLTTVTACQTTTNRMLLAPATIGTALVAATSRLPDIDHSRSGPGHRMNRILPGFPTWLETTFGIRRSPFHWGTAPLALGTAITLLTTHINPSIWWIGVAIGGSWWLHIAADCLTWMGAPLFAPLTFKMIRPRYGHRFKTGGAFERCCILIPASVWCCLAAAATTVHLYQAIP